MKWLQKISKSDRYVLRLQIDDKEMSSVPVVYTVLDYPDGKTRRGTTGSYTLSKRFKSPEQAQQWLKKNLPNFEFKVYNFAITPVQEVDNWFNAREPGYNWIERDYPFNWQGIQNV
jgi:hypothetical protein